MKKLIATLFAGAALLFGSALMAQDAAVATEAAQTDTTVVAEEQTEESALAVAPAEEKVVRKSFHQALKEKFIQGGAGWMTPILLVLILGLALVFERIIYLNMAQTNTEKLLQQVEEALQKGGIPAAKEVCRNTRGPVASIFYQGLERADEGVDMIEKSVTAYGGVQLGRLEKNLSWIAFVIAIAPMLGFLGTVVGMVQAFDDIEAAGDISPTVVAGGMKVALLTTVFGLIVAIIIQTFYNYLSSKVDAIVNKMEDASISFMDLIVKYNHGK
ncbi:MAG: MotA/TolQ/ExbB proton channel family protein [Bacteroidales bacterium]|nr:MotA/TolQ/ExbB proton channel family protein [Bacteroidales bacterium]MDE7337848.1 MotA/TolQ/ExbB proton channel family protein [Bacteroidales bacterium]